MAKARRKIEERKEDQALAVGQDPLLTVSEVGRMVNKTPQTVGRWCTEGLLEFVRLPSGLRAIRQSEVEKFIGATKLSRVSNGG